MLGASIAAEDRHHDQPAIRELVVTDDRVAVVRALARAAETLEDAFVLTGP